MSDTSHCDLAAVLPYAEPVLVSPPPIPLWRAHGSNLSFMLRQCRYDSDKLASRQPMHGVIIAEGGSTCIWPFVENSIEEFAIEAGLPMADDDLTVGDFIERDADQ